MESGNIKISVIVPSYNQGAFISNVVKSVLKQSYTNWELIIQDGASTDETIEICNRFVELDSRISFYSEKDKGFADAVNKALKRVSGTLAVIQSSDDFFAYEGVFQDVINIYEKDRSLTLIAGASVVTDEHLRLLEVQERVDKYVPPENVYLLRDHFSQGATFFLVARAKHIKGLDPTVDMVADTDFWIRMICSEPILLNSIMQTSKIYGGVVIHSDQRSSDFSKFYFGRAKMAVNHVKNTNIGYDDAFKIRHANSLIQSGIDHFNLLNKSINDFKDLFESLNKKEYSPSYLDNQSIKKRLKAVIKRNFEKLGLKQLVVNSKTEYYSKIGIHSLNRLNWFD